MSPKFASPRDGAVPIDVISSDQFSAFEETASPETVSWAQANGFTGALGQVLCVPVQGGIARALVGWGSDKTRARGRLHFATAAAKLPEGIYEIASGLEDTDLDEAAQTGGQRDPCP